MIDQNDVKKMIQAGWSEDEIKGAILYDDVQYGAKPEGDDLRNIQNYIKYRNPSATLPTQPQQQQQVIDKKDDGIMDIVQQRSRNVIDNLSDFMQNTSKDDGVLEDTARVILNLASSPAAKLALWADPNHATAKKLLEANQAYENKDPSQLGGVSLGYRSNASTYNLAADGLLNYIGLGDGVDQKEVARYLALENEKEKRKDSRRTDAQKLDDYYREKEIEKIKIDGAKSFLEFGYKATKDFAYDLKEAFGSEMAAEIILDPTNLISFGGALSKPAKTLLGRIIKGSVYGSTTNALMSGSVEHLKAKGMGVDDPTAFAKGASAGAVIGAVLGGVGGAFAGEPTSVSKPQQTTPQVSQAASQAIAQSDPVVDPQSPKQTPISKVKSAIDEIQSNYEETAKQLGLPSDAAKSVNIENNKEAIINQAQSDLVNEVKNVGNVIAESDEINNAIIKAAQDGTQPNIEVSDNAKRVTLEINNGNSVSDPRLDGTGIVNIISNEIQAKLSGKSQKTPEQLFEQLKSKGVTDELANYAVSAFQKGELEDLLNYVSSKINEASESRVVSNAINNTKSVEGVTNPNEKILEEFMFSDDLSGMYDIPMRYKVVSASTLNPNFTAMTGTQYRFRDNTVEINKVSQSFRPELHFDQGGFEGIPIIDYRNQIIAGNHRTQGIKLFTPESRAAYNAGAKKRFGEKVFDDVPYDDPVVVRELLSKDDDLIARMSAYSNDRRVKGEGEKLATAGGKYAERLKKLDEDGTLIDSENDLLGLGKLNANDLTEAERALLYYQSPDLARALEQYSKAYPDDFHFSQIFTRNAINFWNLRQTAKKFNNPEADILPFLPKAIDRMSIGKDGSKKAMRGVLDEWEDIMAFDMGLSGKGEKLQDLYDLKTDFYGDVFGVLLNYLSTLKDKGYDGLAYRLNALQKEIEEQNTSHLFSDTLQPITPAEAMSYMMRNERDSNPLMNFDDDQRFKAIAEAISLKENEDVTINTDSGGVVRLNEELQGTPSENTIEGSTDGYSAGVDSKGLDDRQNFSDIEGVGQELSRSEVLPDDTGFDSNHIVQERTQTISDGEGDVSQDGLSDTSLGGGLQIQSSGSVSGAQLSSNRQKGSTIELLSDSTTSDLVGNKKSIGAIASAETRADTSTAKHTIERDATERQRDINTRREEQSRAEQYTATELGDADNIAKQLPYLLPEQVFDVKFAEDRFANHRGVLITNQTGTGKTISGLGIAKRFLKRGKNNILIVTPNQQKVSDWIDEGKNLLIDVQRVENTKEAPDGVIATTYANFYQNKPLLEKTYDLIIYDESHSLLENKKGEPTSRLAAHKKITWDNYAKRAGLDHTSTDSNVIDRISSEASSGKVVFLSATPFSSPRSLEYANGILFDKTDIEGLLIDKFGYIANEQGDIIPPPVYSGIDVGALERSFADSLISSGAMRGRKLNNGFDYARQFMKIENSFASKFDDAMSILAKSKNFSNLYAFYKKRLGWLYLSKMGESVKAKELVPFIKEAIQDNNKIVVFHKFVEGGLNEHPFKIEKAPNKSVEFEYNEFRSKYPQFFEDYVFENPIDLYKREFGKSIAFFNGKDKGIDGNSTKMFNDDDSDVKIIMVQSDAGSAGISLHDTTGKYKRIIVKLNLPTRPVAEIQSEGRTYRVGQKTDTAFIYPITGGFTEAQNFSTRINQSIGSVENLALGDGARNLRESFRQDYIDGRNVKLSYKNVKFDGGVYKDNSAETRNPFYMAQMLMQSQKEGEIPHPIALKMSEWADIRGFDSVLNPNAGRGVIAKYLNGSAGKLVAMEKDVKNFDDLLVYTPNALNDDFANQTSFNGSFYDQVVFDAPKKGGLDQVLKSVGLLRRGGRVVSYVDDSTLEALSLADDSSITAQIKMPDSLGGKNVVIIDKVEQLDPPMKIDLSSMSKEEALSSIENMGMPTRKVTSIDALDGNIRIANLGDGKFSLSFNGKIAKERWNDINNSVKSWGGYYFGKERKWIMGGEALINFKEKYLC